MAVQSRKKSEIDVGKVVEYFETLVKIPSPSGFTNKVIDYLQKNAEGKNIEYERTRKGAMIYKFRAGKPDRNVMLSVHVDTLGGIVKSVEGGKIKFDLIGGYPTEYAIGNYCTIHGFDGRTVSGTILPLNPSVHVNKELKEKKVKPEDLFIRPDIKLKSAKDKIEKYVEVGNFVSLDPNYEYVNGFVKSRHLDNKVSAAMLIHIADILAEKACRKSLKLRKNIYFFFNITEETGQGIAGYPDIDDLLVVDMGALGEGLSGDEFSVSICVKDSTGPYNYDFTSELVKICRAEKITFKRDIYPFYGSDGSGALVSGRDIRVALIGAGVGASHGYERTHVDALNGLGRLILKYLAG